MLINRETEDTQMLFFYYKMKCDILTVSDFLWAFFTAFASTLRRLIQRIWCASTHTENPRRYILMCEIRALREEVGNPTLTIDENMGEEN